MGSANPSTAKLDVRAWTVSSSNTDAILSYCVLVIALDGGMAGELDGPGQRSSDHEGVRPSRQTNRVPVSPRAIHVAVIVHRRGQRLKHAGGGLDGVGDQRPKQSPGDVDGRRGLCTDDPHLGSLNRSAVLVITGSPRD
jgi:hypothetical protein